MDNKASNKRTHEQDFNEEPTEIKRSKYDIGLLDLSDCVLTLIFEYVNSFDLYALSLTCTRFNYLTSAKKLWSKVDIRSNPMCGRKFKFFYSNLNDSTRTLIVSGINQNEKCITNYQFQRLAKITSNLTVLAMEYQLINSNEIQLRHFPAGLKELSLRGTHVERCNNFFQEASVRLKNLHTLVLDECSWVGEHSLMALSKFNNLENLSVYKCKNLGDSVAYMSITTRFGFKKLLRIDARLTRMGDQFLKCLNNLRTIREIYLEAPEPFRGCPNRAFLRRMLLGRNTIEPAPPKKGKLNRASTFCLEEFRPCNKIKCSFKPSDAQDVNKQSNELEDARSESGNVIVVSPFEMGQNDNHNDVRVHVLYGNEAPFEFERQTQNRQQNGRQQQQQDQSNDDDDDNNEDADLESDCNDEDQNEILYNDVNYINHNLPMFFQSIVTDDGIRWFTASDTNANDYLGQESLLFRRPFNIKCECAKQREETNEDWDKPGPSGLNKHENETVEENEEECGAAQRQHVVEPVISIRRFGDGPPRRPHPLDIVVPIERRDLRVVIERVEPGIQIIVNNNNNNNNAMFQNNLTRLKVFVVRNFNRLTDRAMQNLSGIRLELLDVTRTSITADAVKRFLLLNPDCRVIHESTCRCKPDR